MNPTIDTILARRSVRMYEQKPVVREIIDQIIACGNAGPSGANNRAWRYVVAETSEFRKKLVERTLPFYKKWLQTMPPAFQEMRKEPDASPDPIYYGAPLIIFVIGKGYTADVDCPIACQNMMLGARSVGLGSCWVYIGQLGVSDPEIKAVLGLVEEEKVFGPIIMGYPHGGFPGAKEHTPLPVSWL